MAVFSQSDRNVETSLMSTETPLHRSLFSNPGFNEELTESVSNVRNFNTNEAERRSTEKKKRSEREPAELQIHTAQKLPKISPKMTKQVMTFRFFLYLLVIFIVYTIKRESSVCRK